MTLNIDDQADDRRMFQRRESERNDDGIDSDRIRVRWQVVAWVLGIVCSIFMTYNATANSMNARVAVAESQINDMKGRFDDMKAQFNRMNDKLDRLIDLAQTRK